MRILLVVHKYPPFSIGGTEIYTRNLAYELQRRGHEVWVYFRREMPTSTFQAIEEGIGPIQARYVAFPPEKGPLAAWKTFQHTYRNPEIEADFQSFLERFNPDVVHFQHTMALSAHLIPIAREKGYPVALTLHDYWFICANAQLVWPDHRPCRGKGLLEWNCARCALQRLNPVPLRYILRPPASLLLARRDHSVREAALAAHLWIAPSRFLIRQYQAAHFPPQRFFFLENGIDVERIYRYAVPQRRQSGPLQVTFIGSLAWQKGVHILVEAFRGLSPMLAQLRIYGNPDVFPTYSQQLRREANPRNTEFMGAVPNEEVGKVLSGSDVIVVPSLWYENSPVIIQEAFAARVPVVASRLGALQEKIQPAWGELFPPGDPQALQALILKLASHRDILHEWKKHLPSPMSIGQHTEILENLYQKLQHGDSP